MATVRLENLDAHYREWGNGDTTILMLHGWPADSTHYEELGPTLAKQGFRVIVPDMPGWGETPPPKKAWTVTDYKEWVHSLAEKLELKDFFLFGHSFGGRVAIKYAVKYPYELKGLILCAAAGIKPDPLTAKRRMLKLTASVGKKAFALPGVNKLAPLAKKVLYKAAGSNDYLNAEGVMKETIVKVLEEDLTPLLNQVSLPTLLIWGTEDTATPLADGEKMENLIPNTQLIVLEGGKHNLPKLVPKKVAEEISFYTKKHYDRVI